MKIRPNSALAFAYGLGLCALMTGFSSAADTGAVGNGDWSSAATWTNGVPSANDTDSAYIGSTYPTGAAAIAVVTLNQPTQANSILLGNGPGTSGTLDLNGYTLTAQSLNLGYNGGTGTLLRSGGGTLSLNAYYSSQIGVTGGSFSFAPGDVAASLYLQNNATVTTAAPGNVTNDIEVNSGCTLTLGADLAVTTSFPPPAPAPIAQIDGTLNANGHTISATFLNLDNPSKFLNRGPLKVGELVVYSPTQITFNLTSGDTVDRLYLEGIVTTLPPNVSLTDLAVRPAGYPVTGFSSCTTSSTRNLTSGVAVDDGCTLVLGADLSLGTANGQSGYLSVSGTVNANGHAISAPEVDIGSTIGQVAILNDGWVTVGAWNQTGGSQVRLHQPGDTLGSILLSSSSKLTIADAAGQLTGLTLTGQTASAISIDSTSDLILDVNGLAAGWVFRWANATASDHIANLQGLINGGEITFSYSNGGSYTITSDGSYTYVNVIPVPEPSATALSIAAAGVLAGSRRWWSFRQHRRCGRQ